MLAQLLQGQPENNFEISVNQENFWQILQKHSSLKMDLIVTAQADQTPSSKQDFKYPSKLEAQRVLLKMARIFVE